MKTQMQGDSELSPEGLVYLQVQEHHLDQEVLAHQ